MVTIVSGGSKSFLTRRGDGEEGCRGEVWSKMREVTLVKEFRVVIGITCFFCPKSRKQEKSERYLKCRTGEGGTILRRL